MRTLNGPKVLMLVVILVVIPVLGCKKDQREPWVGSAEPPNPVSVLGENSANQVSGVSITFQGLVVHVFGSEDGRKDQAVVLEDKHHPVKLNFPASIDLVALERVTGVKPSKPVAGRVTLSPIKGFAVRVVGWDKAAGALASTIHGPLDHSATSFNSHAPNLEKVSDGTLNKSNIDPTLFGDVPDSKDWALFVPLEGGTIALTKQSCVKSEFVSDFQNLGQRYFAAEVALTGTVDEEPAIQFMKTPGTWETVTFTTAPTGVTMRVIAESSGTMKKSHFKEFERLGKPKPAKFDDIVYVDCPSVGLDPACSNSQWP